MQRKQKNYEKGITLIALVITIVVLLILAGATLNIVMNDGLINNSKKAVDGYKVSSYKENIEVIKTSEYFRKIADNLTESLKDLVVKQLENETWVRAVESSEDNNQIKIITEDKYVIIAEIEEDGTITYTTVEKEDGEPYPTLTVDVVTSEGEDNEKIEIKVIAEVQKLKNTKKIAQIELIKNGTTIETRSYNTLKVEDTFQVEENGTYRIKATTDQNKSTTKNAIVNTQGIADEIQMSAQPTTSRNTGSTGRQNGIETGPITVTIIYGETDLQKQYRVGTEEWKTVNGTTATVQVTKNTIVDARYYDGTKGYGGAKYNVQNVDNVAPNSFSITTTKTSNSITVSANATDTASEGAASGTEGILRYEYKINNESWQTGREFNNLSQGTYTIQVKAIDKAGNETISTSTENLGTISTDDIIINSTPSTARNTESTGIKNGISTGPITVTIVYGSNNYTNQYKVGNGNWQTVNGTTANISVTENTTVVARYYDGINGFETEIYNIQNVDNVPPTFSNYNATVNGKTITVAATATDTASEGAKTGIAGIESIKYSINGTNYQDSNTFTVTSSGSYTIYIKAIDRAGNEKIVTTSVSATVYTLTLEAGKGIDSVTGGQTILEGETVTIRATISSGYRFGRWEITSGTGIIADATSATTTVTATSNITIKAIGSTTNLVVSGDNTNGTENGTLFGGNFAYNNPVIPVGFKTSDAGGRWADKNNDGAIDGWDDGLVIEDENGNQFVWVPCQIEGKGIEGVAEYKKHYLSSYSYSTKIEGDDLPYGSETTQIKTFGGFYIGRYEASAPATGTVPQTKGGVVPWNKLNYTNAKNYAQSYKTNLYVKSGLPTGTMWDTTLAWIALSIPNYPASKSYGNYNNSVANTGYTTQDCVKNIYDLAGNVQEWSGEIYNNTSPYRILRGGGYYGRNYAALNRNEVSIDNTYLSSGSYLGFRLVLYVFDE